MLRFFYSGNSMQHTYPVVVPSYWYPKLYIVALKKIIGSERSVYLSTIYIEGEAYLSINNIHLMFYVSLETLTKDLIGSLWFVGVDGGELFYKVNI